MKISSPLRAINKFVFEPYLTIPLTPLPAPVPVCKSSHMQIKLKKYPCAWHTLASYKGI